MPVINIQVHIFRWHWWTYFFRAKFYLQNLPTLLTRWWLRVVFDNKLGRHLRLFFYIQLL
ncbi:MAG TPA: hypothetical protein DHW49_15360 [Anaerolineae bacterium]|nr:hypothetical protein [Anaerolineae bacterium]